MFKCFVYITTGVLCCQVNGQSKIGIEQYNFFTNTGMTTIMPVVHFESKAGWHSELKYNYEEAKTVSFFEGKSFSHAGTLSWSLTPMVGFLAGQAKGSSAAVNIDLSGTKIFFTALPEFVWAMNKSVKNFFYNWSELGYQLFKWWYAGAALQQTTVGFKNKWQAGVMTAIQSKRFTFPLYFFNPLKQKQYFILGISWEWT